MNKAAKSPGTIALGPHCYTVRRSHLSGVGLFAASALPGRRKLGELSGTRVRLPQAFKETENAALIYIVQLTTRTGLDCSTGNDFRHLNHSCESNCYLRIIDKRVEIYTRRPIAPGTELTVDYGATPHADGMRCRCGAAKCRGVI